jgi:hypothetical protein
METGKKLAADDRVCAGSSCSLLPGWPLQARPTAFGWSLTKNVVQRVTPDTIRSRVFAASEAVYLAGISVGTIGAGGLIAALGAAGTFRIGAVGSILACVLLVAVTIAKSSPKAGRRGRGLLVLPVPSASAVLVSPSRESLPQTAKAGDRLAGCVAIRSPISLGTGPASSTQSEASFVSEATSTTLRLAGAIQPGESPSGSRMAAERIDPMLDALQRAWKRNRQRRKQRASSLPR